VCYLGSWINLLAFGTSVVMNRDAPDPRRAVVCNHWGALDTFVLVGAAQCGIVANEAVKSIPVVGNIAESLGCTFVYRGKDAEKRASAKHAIRDKLIELSEGKCHGRYAVFPEGTVTTGKGMIIFKTGVFQPAYDAPGKVAPEVQPVLLRYTPGPFSLPVGQSLSCVEQGEWLFLLLSTLYTKADLTWLPPVAAPVCPAEMSNEDKANIFATHAWTTMTQAMGVPQLPGTLTASTSVNLSTIEIAEAAE